MDRTSGHLENRGPSGRPPQVAVLGAGRWGRNLIRNFAGLSALAAVCDTNSLAVNGAASEHGVPARTLSDVLADAAIDAVALATPASTHAGLALAALEAGKDVFVEKPLALDVPSGQNVCRAAERNSRILMVGHLLRYHPAFHRLQELVQEGRVGRVQYLYSNRLNFGRIRREENILWSFAPHDISMILSLVGSEPDHVSAVGASYLHSSLADVTTTHLSFPSGERAHVLVSWLHPFKEQKLVVVGDAGMAVLDDGEDWPTKLTLYGHHVQWRDGAPQPVKAPPEAIPVEPAEPLRIECEHFLDCVRNRATPLTDGQEGLRVLRVLRAADESLNAEIRERAHALPGVSVHPSATIDDGVEIGTGTRVWHYSHILNGSALGRDCVVGQNVMIGPNVTVGDGCRIQNNVSLFEGVSLGRGVFCGPSCVFTNVLKPRAEVSRRGEFLPTVVEDGATIGANATVVCGNRLGAYCMVGAGAVVTKDVPPHALVVGIPARQVGWVSHDGERLGEDLVCPRSGRRYSVGPDGSLVEGE